MTWGLALLLAAVSAPVGAGTFGLELTAAESELSAAGDARWGFWEPGKYDPWSADADDGFDLLEARAVFGGGEYVVFLAAERTPELAGGGAVLGGAGERDAVELDIEVYDLVIAQEWELADGLVVMPWVGATRILIDEKRRPADDPSTTTDTAKSRLWGAVVGADVGVLLTRRLALTGRASFRWAEGDREAHVAVDPDDPSDGSAVFSERLVRTVYGVDLGLRYRVLRSLHVEGGWRYRSWEQRDGPGSLSGPFVRLSAGL